MIEKLKDVDWIIEVVVENLEVKKGLYEKVDAVRKPGQSLAQTHQELVLKRWGRTFRRFPENIS